MKVTIAKPSREEEAFRGRLRSSTLQFHLRRCERSFALKLLRDRSAHDKKGISFRMRRVLRFVIQGVSNPLVYSVEKTEWDRINSIFEQYRPDALPTFVEFRTENGRLVHVNARLVLLYQALIDDKEQDIKLTSEEANLKDRVSFYVRGIAEPLHYDEMDADEIVDLHTGLAVYDPRSHDFVSFLDANDGPNAIRGEDLVLIESPNYVASENMEFGS